MCVIVMVMIVINVLLLCVNIIINILCVCIIMW